MATDGTVGVDGASTGLSVGGILSSSYFSRIGTKDFVIATDDVKFPFGPGPAFGSILATMDETWAPIGTKGEVFTDSSGTGSIIGTYSIVAPVPLPAALPLLASGIAGLGWVRRRQRQAA